MKTKSQLLLLAFFLIVSNLIGQDSLKNKQVFPAGISIEYGLGKYSVRDEYISNEKYSGTLPNFSVGWSRFHNKHGYRLKLEYRRSTKISNNKISAEVKQFVFNQDFIYPIGKFLLFSKDVFVFLGPSMEIFIYNLEYDFVHHGSNLNADASGYMVSLGINSEFIYKLNTKLNIESFVRLNLLSVVSKEFDGNRYDESSPQLMTVVSATNIDFDLSIRYYVFKKLSVKAGYRLELTRINKWDPFISCSDNLIFSLTYKF